MTDHPGDNADTRFRAYWAGVLGFASFGVVLFLALKTFGPGGGDTRPNAIEQEVIDLRKANLIEVREAQMALVPEEALEKAIADAATALAAKKAAKTELVVPNSPTFIKQMMETAEPEGGTAAEPEGDAAEPDEDPATEKPATEKPAEEKAEE